jgi:cyclic pyranopterin phosphate synthase
MSEHGSEHLIDPFARRVKDLRISITDRCNFRCTYCMPEEGMQWMDRSELLTYEEQARIARVCVQRCPLLLPLSQQDSLTQEE